jgi:uncharacterized membrane protein YeaQ/YmgE (transglycosylase-associated protein family)
MSDAKIARITGLSGIVCVALTFGQFPLWLVGNPPSVYDGRGFAQHLFDIKNVALTRILMDQGIYVSMLVFAAGLRHLIRQARAASEWIGTLLFGAALGWVAVTVVADGLEGGAVLSTLSGHPDPSAVQALIAGTLLIYNGSIAFCNYRALSGRRRMGDVRQRSPATLDGMDRRRRCGALRRFRSCDVRRAGQLQRLLQRWRLGTRHRGELPADDLVPGGQRHPDSPTRHRETGDRASGMN